jgi:hypothetical protein
VSFLSTSVRASPTANLLAQPLNELTPERIFEAIGALTGLNAEIEGEQLSRGEEYEQAAKAKKAGEDYQDWDDRMRIAEDGIASRERARTSLAEANDSWRSRCARYMVDGRQEADRIAMDLVAISLNEGQRPHGRRGCCLIGRPSSLPATSSRPPSGCSPLCPAACWSRRTPSITWPSSDFRPRRTPTCRSAGSSGRWPRGPASTGISTPWPECTASPASRTP